MRNMTKNLLLALVLAVTLGVSWLVYDKYTLRWPQVDSSPSVAASPSQPPKPSKEIEVFLPTPETTVIGTKLVLHGKGRAFENAINYRISDSAGKQLHIGAFMTNAPDAGIFGFFHEEVDLAKLLKNIPSVIQLDILEISAKDGSDLHKTSFLLNVDQGRTSVFAYFTNSNLDPDNSCQKVFALPRLVPKTQLVLKVAIEGLLQGLGPAESKLNFYSSINKGSALKSAKIEGGIAYLDFNETLDSAGGSCNAMAIRSQIEATAQQFSNVKSVVISVNGKTENILQP